MILHKQWLADLAVILDALKANGYTREYEALERRLKPVHDEAIRVVQVIRARRAQPKARPQKSQRPRYGYTSGTGSMFADMDRVFLNDG